VPRYFFDIKNGHRLVDPTGVACASDTDAEQKGRVMARQLAANGPSSPARRLAVIDEQGRELAVIPIEDDHDGPQTDR
jgi:hypothetical protein